MIKNNLIFISKASKPFRTSQSILGGKNEIFWELFPKVEGIFCLFHFLLKSEQEFSLFMGDLHLYNTKTILFQ